jgi:hypothetical protein
MKKLKQTQFAALRKNPRATVQQSSPALLVNGKERLPVTLVDLSQSGAKIQADQDGQLTRNLKEGDWVSAEWTPVIGIEPMTLQGKCAWKTQSQFGIRFDKLDKKTICVLRSLVRFHLS